MVKGERDVRLLLVHRAMKVYAAVETALRGCESRSSDSFETTLRETGIRTSTGQNVKQACY